jgi:hypothetical protein
MMLTREEIVFGLDVAEGGDQTVLAVRSKRAGSGQEKSRLRIEEVLVWTEPDLMATVQRVRDVGDRWGVTPTVTYGPEFGGLPPQKARGRIVVDAIGVGAGVGARLHELRYNVDSFRGNASAPPPHGPHATHFGNLRAAAYWHLRTLMNEGRVDLPTDPRLREEILAMTYYPSPGTGNLYIEDKKELRKRLNRSPDRCDAVVLACWEDTLRISGLGAHTQW